MTHFVYIRSEPQLWTTGFYKPDGTWEPDDDFPSPGQAGNRAAFLNGAGSIEKDNQIKVLEEEVKVLKKLIKTIDDAGLLATVNRLENSLIQAEQIIAAMDETAALAATRCDKLARMYEDGQEKEEEV